MKNFAKILTAAILSASFATAFAQKEKPAEYWIDKANSTLKNSDQIHFSQNAVYSGYSEEGVKEALSYLDSAVNFYPYRLDIWLGMVQLGGLLHDCKMQIEKFEKVRSLLEKSFDKCRLKNNSKVTLSAEKLLEKEYRIAITNYWEQEDDRCYEMLTRKMYDVLPSSVEAINFMAVHYMLNKNDSALSLLQKGEKVAPDDCIIKGNLAEYYHRKGDKKKEDEYKAKSQALHCQ